MYKVFPDIASAQAQADALWSLYAGIERTNRGLASDASLDMRAGMQAAPITVKYLNVITAIGESQAALFVDDFVASQHGETVGKTTIDASSPVSVDLLPNKLKEVILSKSATTEASLDAQGDMLPVVLVFP